MYYILYLFYIYLVYHLLYYVYYILYFILYVLYFIFYIMDMAVPVDIPQVHNNMLITVVQLGKIVLLLITIIIALIILNILCRILTVITSIDTSRKAGLCGEEEEQHKDKGYEETYLENTFRKVVDFLTIPY